MIFECFWIADEVLVAVVVVAGDDDAEHILNSLTQSVESGS